MTEFADHQPYEGEPNEFDLLVGELDEQIIDPYLVDMHRDALYGERLVADSRDEDTSPLREKIIRHLDSHWRYMGHQVRVTGRAYLRNPETGEWKEEILTEKHAVSRGFTFFTDVSADTQDLSARVGHLVDFDAGNNDNARVPAIVLIKHQPHIDLPFPSPELRDRRFAYHYPDHAAFIDELAFTSPRADQIIKGFGEYHFDANLDDTYDREALLDGAQYLRARAEIEPDVNFNVSIAGPVIVIDAEGFGHPGYLRKPYTRKMKIQDIALRPADTTVAELKGAHRCTPYVVAKAFENDPSDDKELLIPCSSILWMSSERYDVPTPPKLR